MSSRASGSSREDRNRCSAPHQSGPVRLRLLRGRLGQAPSGDALQAQNEGSKAGPELSAAGPSQRLGWPSVRERSYVDRARRLCRLERCGRLARHSGGRCSPRTISGRRASLRGAGSERCARRFHGRLAAPSVGAWRAKLWAPSLSDGVSQAAAIQRASGLVPRAPAHLPPPGEILSERPPARKG